MFFVCMTMSSMLLGYADPAKPSITIGNKKLKADADEMLSLSSPLFDAPAEDCRRCVKAIRNTNK